MQIPTKERLEMSKEQIAEFFKLGAVVSKFSEEDLKDPKKAAMLKQYLELKEAYLEWLDAVNDPKKMEVVQEKMKLNEAFSLIFEALSAFMQSPFPKRREPQAYQDAFNCLTLALKDKLEALDEGLKKVEEMKKPE